jgi:hypothetical protein
MESSREKDHHGIQWGEGSSWNLVIGGNHGIQWGEGSSWIL